MKRKIAVILALVLTSSFCVSALADSDSARYITFEANGVGMKLDKTNGEIQRLVASDIKIGADSAPDKKETLVNVVIPSEEGGVKVTAVKQNGFCDHDAMKSLVIPDTVTVIGDYAFNGCDNLTSVNIPSSVTAVAKNCFTSCDTLTSAVLPSSITAIGEYAFSKCGNLSDVNIPDNVTEIGANAFEGTLISSVKIPNKTEKLGNAAFKNCKSLKDIKIGAGVKTIPTDCFNGCDSVETVDIPVSVANIDHTAFGNCKSLKTVIIPATVKKIATDAFNGSKSVTIACEAGSEAEVFAKKAGIATTNIDDAKNEVSATSTAPAVLKEVPDVISVTINGEKQTFTQNPVNYDGSVLVPMRAIFEALGADVYWDGNTKTITATKGRTTVVCSIDKTIGSLDGKTTELPAAPRIVNGSAMVPVRFVSESLGCNVSWERDTQTVIITAK